MDRLEALLATSRAARKTWDLILSYVTMYGPCFTYEDIYRHWRRRRDIRIKALTLDRTIRKLAQAGVLERWHKKKRGFCLAEELYIKYAMPTFEVF